MECISNVSINLFSLFYAIFWNCVNVKVIITTFQLNIIVFAMRCDAMHSYRLYFCAISLETGLCVYSAKFVVFSLNTHQSIQYLANFTKNFIKSQCVDDPLRYYSIDRIGLRKNKNEKPNKWKNKITNRLNWIM